MLLTTSMAFTPSLKAQTAELLNIEVGAAMGRRASQEMGHMGGCVLGGFTMQSGEELDCMKHRRTFYQGVLETWKGKA
jgi:hypothetical protein